MGKFRDTWSWLKWLKGRDQKLERLTPEDQIEIIGWHIVEREEMADMGLSKLLNLTAEQLATLSERYPEKRAEFEAEIDRRDQLNQSYQSYLNASPQNNTLMAYQQQMAQSQNYQSGFGKPVQGALYTDGAGIHYIQTSPIDQMPKWVQFPPPPQNQPSQQILYKLVYQNGVEVGTDRYDTWEEAEMAQKKTIGSTMIRAEVKTISHIPGTPQEQRAIVQGLINDAIKRGDRQDIIKWASVYQQMETPGVEVKITEEVKPKAPPKPPKLLEERVSIYSNLVERIDAMEKKVKVRTEPETDDLLDSLAERVKVLETKLSQLEKVSEKEKVAA